MPCTSVLLSLLAAAPPAWAPQPVSAPLVRREITYQLRRTGKGFTYRTERFEATIAPDGTVTFTDRHGLLPVLLPLAVPKPLPPGTPSLEGTIRSWRARRAGEAVTPVSLPPPARGDAGAGVDRVTVCDARDPCFYDPAQLFVTVSGNFDVTDEYMRVVGQDPYREEKARFLAATSDLRVRMARLAQQRAVRRSLDGLPAELGQIWRDRRFSPLERRRLIFELWRDTGVGPDGARAATTIEAFVQRHLPDGSPHAYGSDELTALPARDDGERFAPYARTGSDAGAR